MTKKGIFYQIPEKYKYSIAFTSKVNPVVSEDFDKYISVASQDKFKKYLPKNIDFNKKIDFLGVCGEAFAANKINLNEDGIATEEAIAVADLFPLSFIDNNHSRNEIIGVIVESSFAEYGTGKQLTREEVKDLKSPFSIILSGIIWRAANPELSDIIEASSDPSSEWHNKIYYSWELAFINHNLILLEGNKTNFEDGVIIKDEKEILKLENRLKIFGGTGKTEDGRRVARIPVGDVIPIAVGIVENPAGQLLPITTNFKQENKESKASNNEDNIIINLNTEEGLLKLEEVCKDENMRKRIQEAFSNSINKLTFQEIFPEIEANDKNIEINENKISQSNNLNVKDNITDNNTKKEIMKLTSITELTDENLKEIKASADIKSLYEDGIKKINEDWKEKNESKEKETKAAKESLEKAEKLNKETSEKLSEVTENLNKLIKANEEREVVEVFSARIETLKNDYDLTEAQETALKEELKTVDISEEAFAKFMKNKFPFLKKKGEKTEDKKEDKKEDKESKASVNDEKTVDDALKNGEKQKETVANAGEVKTKSLVEKAQEAFSVKNSFGTKDKRKDRV